ncbi:hypothetical protein ILP86_18830 [Microbacterium sp. R1]|uniref:NAD-dependent epimerase/dehydratase family protein n=1 Tax=Microbacterium sp. R1 TaxID=322686 RepID=UPI00187D6A39|nr:hypothetical protein [Microbacterium sp. R1]
MKALVVGARGAVGRVVVEELRKAGHVVTSAGRSAAGELAVDLRQPSGLRILHEVMQDHDVVINASGIENPGIAEVGPFVEASATSAYLAHLAELVPADSKAVLGAGLAPGLSSILIAALATRPGDEVDLGVMLGTGERHGAAAVAWTAGLIGKAIHAPPEGGVVRNFIERRALPGADGRLRKYLRADFPDHVLVGRRRDIAVRSYLAVGGRAATWALSQVGRYPLARALVAKSLHIGSEEWHLAALNRRTGETLVARGVGQSTATGVLAALAAERLVDERPNGAVSMEAIVTLPEATNRLVELS